MLRLLADENFNSDILRGLQLRQPDLDIARVQNVGLGGKDDAAVLGWAAEKGRIVLTHDRATMPHHAYDRVATGQKMPGVFILSDRLSVGQAIEEIWLMAACSEQLEWNGQVVYLPL